MTTLPLQHTLRLRDTDDARFDADLASAPLVLVKFGAAWCPPCRLLDPVVEKLAAERSDLLVLSVDVDTAQGVSQRFGIRSVPSVIAFRGGKPVGQLVGFVPRAALDTLLA
jgi:thioredoxin 1